MSRRSMPAGLTRVTSDRRQGHASTLESTAFPAHIGSPTAGIHRVIRSDGKRRQCDNNRKRRGLLMIIRTVAAMAMAMAPLLLKSSTALAQDVPGIEICTVEK